MFLVSFHRLACLALSIHSVKNSRPSSERRYLSCIDQRVVSSTISYSLYGNHRREYWKVYREEKVREAGQGTSQEGKTFYFYPTRAGVHYGAKKIWSRGLFLLAVDSNSKILLLCARVRASYYLFYIESFLSPSTPHMYLDSDAVVNQSAALLLIWHYFSRKSNKKKGDSLLKRDHAARKATTSLAFFFAFSTKTFVFDSYFEVMSALAWTHWLVVNLRRFQ